MVVFTVTSFPRPKYMSMFFLLESLQHDMYVTIEVSVPF